MAKTAAPVTVTTWKISDLERTTKSGKVTTVHYVVDSNNGTYSAGAYGSLGFDGDVSTPYGELTEEQVISWVKEALGDEKIAEVEAALQNRIDEQIAPTQATGVPW